MTNNKYPISKQNFIKYINKLKQLRFLEDSLNSAGELFDFSISFGHHEQLIVDILEDAFEDRESNWISYFLYELDFGSKWSEGIVIMDDEDISMRDAGDLWDVLVSDWLEI